MPDEAQLSPMDTESTTIKEEAALSSSSSESEDSDGDHSEEERKKRLEELQEQVLK